jgi:Lon protease-like protein
MLELPLFPLNTVLFPGATLHLHIFEERYKRMIAECIRKELPFGVVLIRHGLEALGPLAEPFQVGTIARITKVDRLESGQMNITTIGQDRFKIVSLEPDLYPYLIGYVEPFPIRENNPAQLGALSLKLRKWVMKYLDLLAETGVGQFDADQFAGEPVGLAYEAAAILQLSNLQKQKLLSLEWADLLLGDLVQLFRKEIAFTKAFSVKDTLSPGLFSSN